MRFRLGTVLFLLILAGVSPRSSSTARLKPGSDEWVRAKVDALVAKARAAYDDDDREMPAYRRAVQAIASAIKRGRLSDNESFLDRYPEFVGYIEQASL